MCSAEYSTPEAKSVKQPKPELDPLGVDLSKLTCVIDPNNPILEHWAGTIANNYNLDSQGDVEGEKSAYVQVNSLSKRVVKFGIDLNGCVFREVVFNGAYKFLINPKNDNFLWDKDGKRCFLAVPEDASKVLTSPDSLKGVLGVLLEPSSFKIIGTKMVKL